VLRRLVFRGRNVPDEEEEEMGVQRVTADPPEVHRGSLAVGALDLTEAA
jgi:hypothetical protein